MRSNLFFILFFISFFRMTPCFASGGIRNSSIMIISIPVITTLIGVLINSAQQPQESETKDQALRHPCQKFIRADSLQSTFEQADLIAKCFPPPDKARSN